MAKIQTSSTRINSLWSIFYCVIVLCVQGYITAQAIRRYTKARDLPWRASSGTPPEVYVLVFLVAVSLVCLPFFVYLCLVRVGNYASDGIKLGRDHAIHARVDHTCPCFKSDFLRRLWCHLCPLAQTLHVISAFCLILPEPLLEAVEIKYGFKQTGYTWTTNLDFMFKEGRVIYSDTLARFDLLHFNSTQYRSRLLKWQQGDHYVIDVAFLNFAAALIAFSVRYAAVFWYTNKVLGLVFSTQLALLTVESVFSFNGFSLLYRVCYNSRVFRGISLTFGAPAVVVLYILSGAILLFSTVTVFEYGCYYFNEKYKIIDRKHQSQAYVKQSVPGKKGGCAGYVPHIVAMICLIMLVALKGPVIFDFLRIYRATKDNFVLTCVIIDIFYMVYWLILWVFLTVKQQWKFRILDYIPLGKPIFMVNGNQLVHNQVYDADDCSSVGSGRRHRPVPLGSSDTSDYYERLHNMCNSNRSSCASPANTESSLDDYEPRPLLPKRTHVKPRTKRATTPRVTFDTQIRTCASIEKNINFDNPVLSPLTPTNEETELKHLCADLNETGDSDERSVANTSSSVASQSIAEHPGENYTDDVRNQCEKYFAEISDVANSGVSHGGSPSPNCSSSYTQRNSNTPRSLSYCDRPNKLDIGVTPLRTYSEYRANYRTPKFSFLESSKDSGIQSDGGASTNGGSSKQQPKPFSTFLGQDKEPTPPSNDSTKPLLLQKQRLDVVKQDGRRDSANYSLTSSQDTSSTESGNGLCTENQQSRTPT